MKPLIIFLLIVTSIQVFAQENRFSIQAKIVDTKGDPVSDVYIVNLNSTEKDISLSNGIFTINASSRDSLVLSHISYFRKTVTIHSILLDPVIILYSENVDIKEVTVSPDQRSDIDKAMQNIEQIQFDPRPKAESSSTESERVQSMVTAENRVQRVAASSVNLATFSPSESIGKLFTRLKKKDHSTNYSSTRKQKEEEVKK